MVFNTGGLQKSLIRELIYFNAMRCKKFAIVGILLLALFLVSCTPDPGPSAGQIWQKILWVGTLGFLGANNDGLVSFMRILVFILVFALFYLGASMVPGLGRNIAIVVAAVLAIISVIFIPASVLVGVGAAYATLTSVILIGAPIVGGLVLFRMIPGETRAGIAVRCIVLLVLLAILIAVKSYALTIPLK